MILSRESIIDEIGFGPEPQKIGGIAVDLRMNGEILYPRWDETTYNLKIESRTRFHTLTLEHVDIPHNVAGFITGRSRDMRRGLVMPSGWIKPGFEGQILLEFWNMSDTRLSIDQETPICQIVFLRVEEPTQEYDGKYNSQSIND